MRTFEAFVFGYLLNSVWQVPVLFAAAWLIARALRSFDPRAEHRIWVSTFLLQSLLPALPASLFGWLRGLLPSVHRAGLAGRGRVSVEVGPGVGFGMLHLSPGLLSAIVLGFSLFVAYFVARLLWRIWRLSVLRRAAVPVLLSGEAALCWNRCSRSFGVYNATLAASSDIFGPITVGFRRRVVLLPTAMVSNLSNDDLHTVLAHEFAHMRRQDFLKNLLYECATLPARFHPLLSLTRERVIETREMVCDRMAAEATGQTEYAQSLLRLASLLLKGASLRTPHAIGIFDANTFERRLMKLTEKQPEVRGVRRVAIMAASLAFGVATCCSALALHVGVGAGSSRSDAKATPGSATSVKIPSGVMAGSLMSHVNPVYPEAAKKGKIQGSVILHAVIGKDGSMADLQVISGPEELRRSALDAVRQWTYKPYLLNGEAVEVETTVTVNYSLAP